VLPTAVWLLRLEEGLLVHGGRVVRATNSAPLRSR
jgi:hypothetical protein